MARPTLYSRDIADLVCDRIATCTDGLEVICASEDLPGKTTVYKWVAGDTDGFAERYARAKALQATVSVDEMGDVAVKTLKGEYDPQAARVYMDAVKWRAAKLDPKKYGDRSTTVHEDPNGNNPFAALMDAVNAKGRPGPG